MRTKLLLTGCLLLPLFLIMPSVVQAAAGINNTITIQGKLVNADGTNVTDGVHDFVFTVYNGAGSAATTLFTESYTAAALFSSTLTTAPGQGDQSLVYTSNANEATLKVGQVLWNTTRSESVTITSVDTGTNTLGISPTFSAWQNTDTVTNQIYTKDGIFRVALNSLNQDWDDVNFGDDSLFVGIKVGADNEMVPRIRFSSVPYSMTASNSLNLGGITASGFLRSDADDTFEAGHTLTIAGDLAIQDTNIALSGASSNLDVTGNFSVNTDDLYIVKTNGRVGIGTTNPSQTLDVAGNINVTGSLNVNGDPGTNGYILQSTNTGLAWADPAVVAGASNYWQLTNQQIYPKNTTYHDLLIGGSSTASATIALQATTGNLLVDNAIGIGTTSPLSTLEVRNPTGPSLRLSNDTSNYAEYGAVGTRARLNLVGINTAYDFVFDGNTRMSILEGGNVGIGTTNPGYLLDVAGDINTTGTFRMSGTDYGQYFIDSAGTNNYVWTSDGSGRGTWVDPATLGQSTNYWQLTGEQISPKNALWNDLMIGGTSTASAKFFAQGTTGNGYFAGNLGIGTTSPSTILQINKIVQDDIPQLKLTGVGNYSGSPTDQEDGVGIGLVYNANGNRQFWIGDSASGNGFRINGYSLTGWNYASKSDADLSIGANSRNVKFPSTGNVTITGNVSIGTTSPTAKLDVAGDASASGSLVLRDSTLNTIDSLNGGRIAFNTSVGGDAGLTERMTILNNGNVGIGTTSPLEKLHVSSSTSSVKALIESTLSTGTASVNAKNDMGKEFKFGIAGSTFAGYEGIQANDGYILSDVAGSSFALSVNNNIRLYSGSGTLGLFQNNVGSIGIGTSSPTAKLDVVGDASASGSLVLRGTSPSTIDILNGSRFDIQTSAGGDAGLTPRLTINGNGNVGIGTTNPTTKLDIQQSAAASTAEEIARYTISDDSTAYIALQNSTQTDNSFVPNLRMRGSSNNTAGLITGQITTDTGTSPAFIFRSQLSSSALTTRPLFEFQNYTTPILTLNASGNVGIGTTNPGYLLDVAGDINTTGTFRMSGTDYGQYFIDSAGTSTQVWTSDGTGRGGWADLPAGTSYTAGNDLDLSGNTFNIESQLDYVTTISQDSSNLTLQTTTSGNIILNSAGTIELQDNTNVTGNLDISGTLTAGTANAFQVSATGEITAITNETINGIDINAGTISDATWNGTAVGTQYGGTGQNWSAVAQGSLPYFNNTGTMTTLGATTNNGYVLKYNTTSHAPEWAADTDTNTTYTAGNDIDITGTQIDIESQLDYVSTISRASSNLALQTTTSGDITLTTGAAAGLVNVLTGNLKVGNGTPGLTLNGEDAYIEGTLEVDGTTQLDGTLDANGNVSIADTDIALDGASTNLTATGNFSLNTDDLVVLKASGNVGIGTTSPGYLLDVAGDINTTTGTFRMAGTDYGQYFIDGAGTNGQVWTSDGSGRGGWTTLAGSTNYWQLNAQQLSPANSTLDLMVGGTATSSAKFFAQGITGNGYFAGNVGIGTTTLTTAKLNLSSSNETTVATLNTNAGSVSGGDNVVLRGYQTTMTTNGTIDDAYGLGAIKDVRGLDVNLSDGGEINAYNGDAAKYLYGVKTDVRDTGTHVAATGSNNSIAYGGYLSATGKDADVNSSAYGLYAQSSGADTNYGLYGSTTAGTGQTAYGLYVDAGTGAGTEYAGVFMNGSVGIGTTNPGQKLTVDGTLGILEGGSTPTYHTIFQGGNQSGDLTYTLPATSANGLLKNTSGTLSWDTTAYMTNPMTTAGDLIYGGTSGAPTRLDPTSNNGYVLKYNTTSHAPEWAADTDTNTTYTAGNDIDITGTQIDIESQLDYVSTISRASSNLTLQTTTSGDITLTTGAAAGLVNVLTGNLKVGNGTPGLTLDGEDAYIEGTLEVDGTTQLDGNLTANGTLDGNGIFTLGDGGDPGTIDTSSWDISINGAASGFTGIASSGNIDLSSLSAGGLVKAAVATGRLSIASSGTDYEVPLTFSNGLTRTSNDVHLGGSLTETTTITQGANNLVFNLNSTGVFDIQDNGTSAFFVKDDGNVGIGTTNPAAKLDIAGVSPILRLTDTQDKTWTVGDVAAGIEFYSSDNSGNFPAVATAIKSIIENEAFGNEQGLGFYTNNDYAAPVERMRLSNEGYLGIGTTTPGTQVDIVGTTGLRLSDVVSDSTNKVGYLSGRHYANSEEDFSVLRFDSTTDANIIYLGGSSGTRNAATDLRFLTAATNTTLSGTERLRITNSGNVGIGTTSPGYLLDVAGDINTTGTFRMSGTDYGQYFIDGAGTNGQVWTSDGSGRGSWQAAAGGGTNYWQVNDKQLSPANSTLDLMVGGTATASAKFFAQGITGNGYFAGNVGIGTTSPGSKLGITTTGANYGSNVLSTFTSTLGSGGGEWRSINGYKTTLTASGEIVDDSYNAGTGRDVIGYDVGLTDSGALNADGGTAQKNLYGIKANIQDTGSHTLLSGTNYSYTYGGYLSATGTATNVDGSAYGLYAQSSGADTNYGLYGSTSAGTGQTAYGLYVDAGTGAGTEYAGVFMNGSVGIGTTAPSGPLHVYNGTTSNITFNLASTGDLDIQDNGTSKFFVKDDGRIGINTTTIGTTAQLYIDGNMRMSNGYFLNGNTYYNSGGINSTTTSNLTIGAGESGSSGGALIFQANAAEKMRMLNSGYFGIGTTNPGYKFQVYIDASNEGHVDSTGAWARSSDQRLKQNITTLTDSLSKVMNLRAVRYDSNSDVLSLPGEGKRIGFIAQELEQIYPEFVNTDANGMKSVAYESLTPVLAGALQELNLKVDTLGNLPQLAQQVNQLDAQFSSLSVEVATHTDWLTDLKNQLTSLFTRQTQVETQTDLLTATMTDLQTQVATLSALPALQNQSLADDVGTLSARISYLEQQVATSLAPEPTPSTQTLENRLTDLETQIATISSKLAQTVDLSVPIDASTSALLDTLTATASDSSLIATDLHLTVGMLNADAVFVNDFLSVTGDAVITNLEVTNSLNLGSWQVSVGNSMLMIGDLITLDSTGSLVTVNGNLKVTGLAELNQLTTVTATVAGAFSAPIIDQLSSKSAELEAYIASLSAEISTLKSQLATPSADATVSASLPADYFPSN